MGNRRADSLLARILVIRVTVAVALLEVRFGMFLRRADLSPQTGRAKNIASA